MNLDFVRNIIYIISKDKRKNIQLTPEKFGEWLHLFSMKQFKRKVGLPEQYQPGMPLPQQAYEITERIGQDLRPFKVLMGKLQSTPHLTFNDLGYADIPFGFYYPGYMLYDDYKNGSSDLRRVDILSDLEWANRVGDPVEGPTFRNPIANFQKDFIRIWPASIKRCEFEYLRIPIAPVFGYSKRNGWVEYDEATSTELEWDDLNVLDIISLFLVEFGIAINAAEIANYAEMVKTKGI